MFCESCGSQIAVDGAFCPSCGAKVGASSALSSIQRAPSSTEIADKAKVASHDTLQSIKLLAVDPTGGLLPAFQNLDKQRALIVSLIFAFVFDFCLLFAIQRFFSAVQNQVSSLDFLGYLGFEGFAPQAPSAFKLLLFGFVPFVGLVISLYLARLVFRGSGEIEGDTFTAGAALLPFGFLILVGALLGFANLEVIAVLFLFALCYTILILFTGCTRIGKISDAGAAVAVPLVLLLSAYVSKVIFSSLWTSGIGG